MIELNKKSGIVLALDVDEYEKFYEVLDQVGDLVDGIKLNLPFILKFGIKECKEIKKNYNKPIIGDFKIADIYFSNRKVINICIENMIDYLFIHGFIGVDNLADAKFHALDRIKFFLVTDLTTCGTKHNVEILANIAKDMEFFGVQVPGTKPEVVSKVRNEVGESVKLISCGIGYQGPIHGSALRMGADYEIIGRKIYLNESPREITKSMISDFMRGGLIDEFLG